MKNIKLFEYLLSCILNPDYYRIHVYTSALYYVCLLSKFTAVKNGNFVSLSSLFKFIKIPFQVLHQLQTRPLHCICIFMFLKISQTMKPSQSNSTQTLKLYRPSHSIKIHSTHWIIHVHSPFTVYHIVSSYNRKHSFPTFLFNFFFFLRNLIVTVSIQYNILIKHYSFDFLGLQSDR